MEKQKLKFGIAVIAAVVLLASCTAKKETQQESEPMQMSDEKTDDQSGKEVKVFEGVDPSTKAQVNKLLKNYNALIQALANDDADKAKTAAKAVEDHLSAFDMSNLKDEQMTFYHQQAPDFSYALKKVSESKDIEQIRMETVVISDKMYALVKAYGGNTGPVYYNYCPMANNNEGAFWLSDVSEIKNPYMGHRMPACGTTKEILE